MRASAFRILLLSMAVCLAPFGGCTAEDRPAERVSPTPEINPNAVVWRTPTPPAAPQAGDVWVNPKDAMEMVYIAPGEFTLGTSDGQIDAWIKEHPTGAREELADQRPQCRVRLAGYWIGRTEVTNAQYLRFAQPTGHRAPKHWEGGKVAAGLEDFPVVLVSWDDARAYCKWAGGRLPSELEWEKAARGSDGRVFPWGNQWDAKWCRNFESLTGRKYPTREEWILAAQAWLRAHDSVREGPAAAGSYPADLSPYGCRDMAGNVLEWCADWYEEKAYQRYAKGDLSAPKTGEVRVLRGGSWARGLAVSFRAAGRWHFIVVGGRDYDLGFRCARDAVR